MSRTGGGSLCFRNNVLYIPGYSFDKACQWEDTGSLTFITEGRSLKEGALVLAKIAPAHSPSSMCLQREAHILGKLGELPEASSAVLRMIEFLTLPRVDGDCVVLLLVHPGPNLLPRYFPPSKVNDFLLGDLDRSPHVCRDARLIVNEDVPNVNISENTGETNSLDGRQQSDLYDGVFLPPSELDLTDLEKERYDVMDLASFLEFAIQATHCLEMVHRLGFVHREVRANAFHLNVHSGDVRLVHFGNRSMSLEDAGGPSQLVINCSQPFYSTASTQILHTDSERTFSPGITSNHGGIFMGSSRTSSEKVIEVLHYLAPEQTSSYASVFQEDHRTDLYSLGMLFWTCVVGRGRLPFISPDHDYSPAIILAASGTTRPPLVSEVRNDVPTVISDIIDKLLSKSPDARYQGAYGLKADLLECQKRLLASVETTVSVEPTEIIPSFQIGLEDKHSTFAISHALYGRDKELEIIRNVIRHNLTSFARRSAAKNLVSHSVISTSSHDPGGDEDDDMMSISAISSEDGPKQHFMKVDNHSLNHGLEGQNNISPSPTNSVSLSPCGPRELTLPTSDTPSLFKRNGALSRREQGVNAYTVIVVGLGGVGKSSLVMANQEKWKPHGLWAQAKFQAADRAPYITLLAALSSALRQLMFSPADANHFVQMLNERLGPQLVNLPLLFASSPSIRAVFKAWGMNISDPESATEKASKELMPLVLATSELSARFQSLIESVFAVIADIKPLALFLDDLHEADDASLRVIEALINSRTRLVIFATIRPISVQFLDRVRSMCSHRARATWIMLEPLSFSPISQLVAKTLHRSREECSSLSRLIYTVSGGNAFAARNVLSGMHRQQHITFASTRNYWQFDIVAIESCLENQKATSDRSDQSFLIANFRELPESTRKYLMWASMFGTLFKPIEVSLLVDWEESSESSSDDEVDEGWDLSKTISMLKNRNRSAGDSIRGLQGAIQEGWVVYRGTEMCSFAHDWYRQAVQQEVSNLPDHILSKLSFRIILAMLHDAVPDVHRIAEHAGRCIPLLLGQPNREELLDVLVDAGESAWERGAHELAFQAFLSARNLQSVDHWAINPGRSSLLLSKLAELYTWKGNLVESEQLIVEYLQQTKSFEDQACALRIRARNHFLRNEFADALKSLVLALHNLGVEVDLTPSEEVAEQMFERVKNQILEIGYEEMVRIQRATDPRIDLAVSLLNDAGTNAYWSMEKKIVDVIGLTTIDLALRFGISPGSSLGFFWAIGAAAEQRGLFKFCVDLGKLALHIAYLHGGNTEKCRAIVLYTALVAPFSNVHIRHTLPLLEEGLKYGHSSGDRGYTCFATLHIISTRLYDCEHLSTLAIAAEEATNDIETWTPDGDATILAHGLLCCIRAIGGYKDASSADNVFDTSAFNEKEYQTKIVRITGSSQQSLAWYNAYKVVGLFCTGFVDAAAQLGFMVYETRGCHPNHRFSRYAAFFHSLALIACVRRGALDADAKARYIDQVVKNQAHIRRWLSSSPVNTGTWIALIEAELASLNGDGDALRLYDMAVKLASNHKWLLEEGFALYLQGSHFIRVGVESLGSELQNRGISKQSQWGAQGIVRNLSATVHPNPYRSVERSMCLVDSAAQTDIYIDKSSSRSQMLSPDVRVNEEQGGMSSLEPSDLMLIIKKSKEIADCSSLSSALQRLTEIAADISLSECCCIVITTHVREYGLVTLLKLPEMCRVFENPRPLRTLENSSQITVIQTVLDSKQSYCKQEPNAELHQSLFEFGLPIFSNRGHTLGAIYLSAKEIPSHAAVTTLTVLVQQASISVSSAILFRSVQAGTRENLRMIASQREALEVARKSREDAIRATRVKSRFIANMSHEMRTPFSSFYGLLDLLNETELNSGQREIVDTAKQSCEILLKIIDSILDYSKLEASAMKVDITALSVESVIADCLELFLPLAAKKLHLSYNIEEDVPEWILSDHTRIRQVLMNLIGNAVKFTESGSVTVLCSVDKDTSSSPLLFIKFSIEDTGIGLSPDASEMLFVPFQQADNSSTRRFGGTGLGLSISQQLVKLLGGAIGVNSNVNVGSTFWFTLPVKVCKTDESRKASSEVDHLRDVLSQPSPSKVIVCSVSSATRALLRNILRGFDVTLLSDLNAVHSHLGHYHLDDHLDFLILDEQIVDFIQVLPWTRAPALRDTKIVHLYTPSSQSLSESVALGGDPTVFKIIKPPRKARILQVLAELKGLTPSIPSSPIASSTPAADPPVRTLYGNILVAEDNAVARGLLVKQLQRYQFEVVATNDGSEALRAWESHEPGYFSLALFDHHMPVCDGVEATRRLRQLESVRCPMISLPVIALSADAQESTKLFCLSAGMDLFLSKPLRKPDLLSLLSSFGSSATTAQSIP